MTTVSDIADLADSFDIFNMADSPNQQDPTIAQQGPPAGLVRPKRRVVKNLTKPAVILTDVQRNYQVGTGTQFTNFRELKKDMLSPEYAQEILEEVAVSSSVDMSNPKAMKMFEDVIYTFYIQNSASTKTSYEFVVDIYGVEFDFLVLLRTLVAHGTTPRRFVRGLADRIYQFLTEPDNQPLRVDIQSKHSVEDFDDTLICFDGSTHITNMATAKRDIAYMFASRGIYENAASLKAADERTTFDGALLQKLQGKGMHQGAS